MGDRYEEITAHIKVLTDFAVSVEIDGTKIWLPLSRINTNITEQDIDTIIDIEVSEWLLIEHELI